MILSKNVCFAVMNMINDEWCDEIVVLVFIEKSLIFKYYRIPKSKLKKNYEMPFEIFTIYSETTAVSEYFISTKFITSEALTFNCKFN